MHAALACVIAFAVTLFVASRFRRPRVRARDVRSIPALAVIPGDVIGWPRATLTRTVQWRSVVVVEVGRHNVWFRFSDGHHGKVPNGENVIQLVAVEAAR